MRQATDIITTLLMVVTLVSILVNGSVAEIDDNCPVKWAISTNDLQNCSNIETISDDECKSLQQVLDMLSSLDHVNCASISIKSGNHYLTSPVNFNARNVQMIGVGSIISITCEYSTVRSNGSEYMWLFDNTTSVIIKNLDFYNCPYPFRILHTQHVYLVDSSFR